MFNDKRDDEEKPKAKVSNLKKIKPLRDFVISHNEHNIILIKGADILVPKIFLQNLKTEKVIK